ncbi:hypothetical protein, partial [Fertoeibacter niger]|uniref:hypothetical protein n=1 Tax=Fertoeibacter niger TaxID=2656921 RepID=UPI001C2D528D
MGCEKTQQMLALTKKRHEDRFFCLRLSASRPKHRLTEAEVTVDGTAGRRGSAAEVGKFGNLEMRRLVALRY